MASPSSSETLVDPDLFAFDEAKAPRTFRFTTTERFFANIQEAIEDIIVVTHVSLENLEEINNTRWDQPYATQFWFRRFNADTQILVIAKETKVHQALHKDLWDIIARKLAAMHLKRTWAAMGVDTTYWAGGDEPSGDRAEPQCCGGPVKSGRTPLWPSLVIGGADFCPLGKLREDMFWWFTASGHEVKVLLLTKVDRLQGTIVVEHWAESERVTPREGAASTRAYFDGLEVVLQGSVTMTWNDEGHPSSPTSYSVSGAPLEIPIKDLFLRTRRQQDRFLVLTEFDLRRFASFVWAKAVMLANY